MSFINPANLSAPQRIERVTALIMADKNLMQYGPLILFARVQVGKARTAYTDGRIAVIGAEFIKELDDAELAFVVLHEILHIAYRHLYIYRHLVKKDAEVSNRAMDYVINLQLAALAKLTKVLRVPMKDGKPNCLLDAKYLNLTSEQVFDILYKKKQEEQEEDDGGGNGQPDDGDGDSGGHGGFDEHDWDAAGKLTDQEEADLKREVEQAVRHGANLASKANGNVSRDMQGILESHFDWRVALEDYLRAAFSKGYAKTTFRRLNRRLQAAGVYMGSTRDDSFRRIVVAVDTSGSISGTIISGFLGHIVKIVSDLNPQELILMYWDTEVCAVERYGADVPYEEMLTSTRPAGGGGTDPACIPQWLKDNDVGGVECVLVLTDGYFFGGNHGDWNDLPEPLWCVLKPHYDRFDSMVGNAIPID